MSVPPSIPAQATIGEIAQREHDVYGRFGALPWVALAAAMGLALVSCADAVARSGHGGAEVPFWFGIAAIVLPAALRLSGEEASSGERAATVVLVGMTLYGVKVLRDPFGFTFGDELAHAHNLLEILRTGELFGSNSILPITPRYPGVESVGAALTRLGGTSPFAGGLLVIAAARAMLLLALYLLYERLTGSARVAGLAALVYAATPTFVFFSAQFSYESLALPLAGVALLALLRWMTARDTRERVGWALVVILAAAAAIATHHLTAYALVGVMAAVSVLHLVLRPTRVTRAPWVLTGVVGAMALAWLAFVASRTVGYLSPVISDAFDQVIDTVNREAKTRTLFKSEGAVESTPPLERGVALLAVLVTAVGVLVGERVAWRRWRRDPMVVVLALGALAYLGTLPLRLVPAAWETASRASGFLFVGVALVVALGGVWLLERRPASSRGPIAAAAVLLVAGGVIAGWPASLRQAQTFRTTAGGRTIEPQGVAAARWSRDVLGPRIRVAAEDADARLFLVYGDQTAFQGVNPDYRDLLRAPTLEPWQTSLLRSERITLVVADRREVSGDNIAGYFFDRGTPRLRDRATAAKFERADVDRIYDSGDLVIFDVRGL